MLKIELTPEQSLLQESAARYLADKYDFTLRSKLVASGQEYDKERWGDFADMGWLALPFPGDLGGDGSAFDLLLLSEALGRALVVEPYISTVVLGGMTIAAVGTDEQKQRLLPDLIAGRLHISFGHAEPQSDNAPWDVLTRAEVRNGKYVLNGHKAVVLGAASADYLIISARTSGGQRDRDGLSLFLVPRTAAGISLREYQTLDGRRAAEVLLKDVHVDSASLIGARDGAASTLDATLLNATVAMLGEAVGCLEGAVERTADYLNTREQFGRKLSSFQALRHRVADMYVAKEEVKALCMLAAHSVAENTAERFELVSAAKAYAGRIGRRVCEEAVQMHGAIAITDEYIVGHYLKRLIVVDRLFGDGDYHLERYMDARGRFDHTDA